MQNEDGHSAICLDCGRTFWGWNWDRLFGEMDWHDPKHVIHVWDEESG